MMPIYLVRWPDLSASLVRAGSEEELLDILDQVANPEGCDWSVYDGPLFIDFRFPVEWHVREGRPGEPVTPEQIVLDDVDRIARLSAVEAIEVALAGGDDGAATGEEIIRRAFPELHGAIERLWQEGKGEERDGVLPEHELRQALHAELARLLRASWRRAQLRKKDDPISALAREMDLPVSLARKYAEIVANRNEDGDDPTED